MERWMPFFVCVTAAAVVLQTVVLLVMYSIVRKMNRRVEQVTDEVRDRVLPLVSSLNTLVEDVRPQIVAVLANATEITTMARNQAHRVDRVMGEALERLRLQLAHVDQILTGTLETMETVGSKVRSTVWAPVHSVSALVRGIQTGLDVYRGRVRRRPMDGAGEREQTEEDLFI
jgi:hypothetical protein